MILAERAARLQSEARAAHAEADLTHSRATASSADALIARLKLEIEKLRRTLYGVSWAALTSGEMCPVVARRNRL